MIQRAGALALFVVVLDSVPITAWSPECHHSWCMNDQCCMTIQE